MARTLVIKGANFASNMLARVTFAAVDCEDIIFDETEVTIDSLESYTLSYTLVPPEATGDVTWSSSNTDVVTVSEGVLTVVGIGEAVITATCGSQSATCTVTVNIYLSNDCLWTFGGMVINSHDAGSFLTPTADTSGRAVKSFVGSASSNSIKVRNDPNTGGTYITPYKIPKGASKFVLTSTNLNVGYLATFYDSTNNSTYFGAGYPLYLNMKVDYSGAKSHTCDFSDLTDADSVIISVVKSSGDAVSGDEEGITIQFVE